MASLHRRKPSPGAWDAAEPSGRQVHRRDDLHRLRLLHLGLPSNPQIQASYTVWKWLAKLTGLARESSLSINSSGTRGAGRKTTPASMVTQNENGQPVGCP